MHVQYNSNIIMDEVDCEDDDGDKIPFPVYLTNGYMCICPSTGKDMCMQSCKC